MYLSIRLKIAFSIKMLKLLIKMLYCIKADNQMLMMILALLHLHKVNFFTMMIEIKMLQSESFCIYHPFERVNNMMY